MDVSTRIYYDKVTGDVLVLNRRIGSLLGSTVDGDFLAYQVLKDRVRDTVGVIELSPESYEQDFAECSGLRVDVATQTPLFTYPGNTPTPVYQQPLTEQIAELKSKDAEIILTLVMNDLM